MAERGSSVVADSASRAKSNFRREDAEDVELFRSLVGVEDAVAGMAALWVIVAGCVVWPGLSAGAGQLDSCEAAAACVAA